MKRTAALLLATGLTLGSGAVAGAQTNPDDPNDVEAIDNPVDDNDNGGFDDWGLLGLLGLLGLAGLARRPRQEDRRTAPLSNDPYAGTTAGTSTTTRR